jgi:geranylgeranyl pyrophosphate synthase
LTDRVAEAGQWIGRSFQVIDDILDIVSTTEELGKTAGKDRAGGKMTYPATLGLEASKRAAKEMTEKAFKLLEPSENFGLVKDLARHMLERTF